MNDKTKKLETLISAIPCPTQIKDIDLVGEENAIRFTWRGVRFRIGMLTGLVEEVDGGLLRGSNIAILLETLITRTEVASK